MSQHSFDVLTRHAVAASRRGYARILAGFANSFIEEGSMNDRTFDFVTLRAVRGFSRRATLTTLGTAGLAALAHPFMTEAKKKGGKNKRDRKDKNTKTCPEPVDRCTPQTEQCTAVLSAFCGGDPNCLDSVACCSFLGSCDATTFLTCLANAG